MHDDEKQKYVAALEWLLECLGRYAKASHSERGYVVEPINEGHPVHEAVKAIQKILKGPLPHSMKSAWMELLKLSRLPDRHHELTDEDEDGWLAVEVENAAGELEKLTRAEIERTRASLPPADVRPPARKNRKPPRATVNAQILEELQKDNAKCSGWTARQWAMHLKCAASTIVETKAWKKLASLRFDTKASRVNDRRQKKKHTPR